MSVIYLTHPRHGVKIATMDLEAQQDEANGWTRVDNPSNAALELGPVNMMACSAEGDTMPAEAPRRRGRPRVNKDD